MTEPRYTITEDEHEHLDDICNLFYRDLSALVAKMLDRNSKPELEALLLDKLEEHASVHGSDYQAYRRGRKR